MNKNINIFQIAIHFLTNSCTSIRPYTGHIGNMFSVQRNIGQGRSVLVFYGCWNKLTQIGQLRTMQLYSLKFLRPEVQSQYHCARIKVLVPLEALWENLFLSSSTSDGCWQSLACGYIIPVFKASIFKLLCSIFTSPSLCVRSPSPSLFWSYMGLHLWPTQIIQDIISF